jgi:hypothetical protein
MQRCPNCGGGELKIIAAILERPVIEKILSHLGLDPQPLPKGRAREAALTRSTRRWMGAFLACADSTSHPIAAPVPRKVRLNALSSSAACRCRTRA